MIAKLTSKNQLTLPRAALEAVGRPTHFRVVAQEGVLILFPATLMRSEVAREALERAEELGVTDQKLRGLLRDLGAGRARGGRDG